MAVEAEVEGELSPVSLVFMREADRKLFRLKEKMDVRAIPTEGGLLGHLSLWGRLPNCHDVTFVLTVPGHDKILLSGQVVLEYVHDSYKRK